MSNEYVCAACFGTFEKGWTDEEAQAECDEIFGDHGEEQEVVCDGCWRKMMGLETVQ